MLFFFNSIRMREKASLVRSKHRHALDATIASLRLSGLWISKKKSRSICDDFYKIYNKSVIAIICIFAIAVFTDLCLNYDDLVILTDDGCIFAGISVIIFKIYNFQLRCERIKSVIEKIHAPIDILNQSSDSGVRAVVRKCSFYEKLLLHSFWTIGGILSVALIFLVPVEDGDLPIRARYPFDVRVFPMHQIAFFMQASAVTTGLIAIIGMDSVVIGLYKWINVQLFVLNANYENCAASKSALATITTKSLSIESSKNPRNKISSFVIFDVDEARAIGDHDSFVIRYKICIKHHQRLIHVVDELNQLFSSSMCVQLFASFSMICLTGFQAVLGAKNLSSLLKFGVYLGAAFSQLLNWCWIGNSLIYQSASLTTSQWLSGWEDYLTPEVTPLMIVSIMQSQKSIGLRAGEFVTVSMQTFIKILRSSYSFFAILTEMNGID